MTFGCCAGGRRAQRGAYTVTLSMLSFALPDVNYESLQALRVYIHYSRVLKALPLAGQAHWLAH